MLRQLMLAALLTLTPLPVLSQHVINAEDVVIGKSKDLLADKEYPLATELILKQKRVFQQISKRSNYHKFTIEILSRYDTRIKIKWQDDKLVLQGGFKSEMILQANKGRPIVFVAFGPTAGTITVTDEQGKTIKEIPYQVKERSTVRQTINVGTSTALNSIDPRVNISYSRSMRGVYADEGSWNFRVSTTSQLSDLSKIRVNVSVGHSW